ncbi:MAG: hypothetical protein HYW86_02070 [Candidatus Roizmanbacteria bacterium]|nr:MAG: hypothetical protein HYW86_02070 [Candidatus Roizmanbacteria bacterium]
MSGEKLSGGFDKDLADDMRLGNTPEENLLIRLTGDPQVNGTMYAWGKTARLVTQKDFLKAVDNTCGDFFMLDVCSSYPTYAQMIRERRKQACYDDARKIIGEVVVSVQKNNRVFL